MLGTNKCQTNGGFIAKTKNLELMAIAEMIEDRIDGFSKSGIIHRLTRDLGRGPAKAAEKFIHENTETLRDKQRALELAQVLRNSAVDGFEKRGLPIPRELAAILNKRGP